MPSILVVATDGARRAALVDALERRFGADYDVVARSTGDDVGPEIGPLAVALAPIDAEGLAALRVVGATHLAAKRIAVVEVGDRSVSGELAKATTLGQVDHYVGHPWASPEEELYPVVTEALRIWSYDQRLRLAKLTIVDESVHGLGATLASLLEQNSVAVVQHLAHSPEGQALLDGPLAGLPLLALRFWGRAGPRRPDRVRDGQGPRRPDPPRRRPRATFPSWAPGRRPGRLGVRVVRRVADAHREGGGRRPGRDELEGSHYLGFPWGVRGGDFAQQTHRQAEQLGAEIVATRSAIGLTAEGDVLLLRVERRRGPHPLGDPHGCDQLPANRNAVRRRADRTRRPLRRGGRRGNVDGRFRVAVLGGCNSSGQAAAKLAAAGDDVTMLVRRDSLGRSMSGYLVTQLEGTPAVTIRCQLEVAEALGDAELEALVLRDTSTGKTDVLPNGALFVFIGAVPFTDWLDGIVALDGHGLVVTGSDGPDWLETSMPRVHAAGDTRAGSIKRVAAAVGEGSTAAMLARAALQERPTIP